MAGLERTFPGIQEKLMEGDKIASRYSIIIDGCLAGKSLWTPVDPTSEVHFLPAISGGTR